MPNVTNSQLTKVYLAPIGTDVSTSAAIETAIGTAKPIICLQSDIDTTVSKAVTEYKCLSSNTSKKAYGTVSLPNFPMDLLFDADDTDGQADLRTMWDNTESRILIIELTDGDAPFATIASGEAYPTTITMEVGVPSLGETMAIDAAVMQKAIIEMESMTNKIYYDATNTKT
jgi:hypothetical protein